MAQYFYDMSVCSPSGGKWPALFRGHNTSTINSDVYVGPTIGGANGRSFLFDVPTNVSRTRAISVGINAADVDIVRMSSRAIRDLFTSFTNTGGGVIVARGSGFVDNEIFANGYYIAMNASTVKSSAERSLRLFKRVDNLQTDLGGFTNALPAYSADSPDFYTRLQCVGTTIRAKAWLVGQSEPEWQIVVTDTSLTTGDVGVCFFAQGGCWKSYFLSVGTNGDMAPYSLPSGPRILTGVVRNPSGSAVSTGFIVRCYHRESGAILGETSTNASGAYTFYLNLMPTEEVYCLAIDNLGNSWGIPTVDRPVS